MEMDRVMRQKEVSRMIGFSRGHLYRMIAQKRFPEPFKMGRRAVGWKQSEVQAWIDGLREAQHKVAG